MTAQITDTILINDEEYKIHGFVLNQYWEKNNIKPSFHPFNTALSRGYFAKWSIKNQKLFLIEFHGQCFTTEQGFYDLTLDDLFPLKDFVIADWFTGNIDIPLGDVTNYSHSGFGNDYEYRTTITIENGVVTDPGVFLM